MTPCPKCRGTGEAHRAPCILPDLFIVTLCDCEVGKAIAARVATKKEDESCPMPK